MGTVGILQAILGKLDTLALEASKSDKDEGLVLAIILHGDIDDDTDGKEVESWSPSLSPGSV